MTFIVTSGKGRIRPCVPVGFRGVSDDDVVHRLTIAAAARVWKSALNDKADPDQRRPWGMVGHYTIVGAACRLGPPGTKLAQLLLANLGRNEGGVLLP